MGPKLDYLVYKIVSCQEVNLRAELINISSGHIYKQKILSPFQNTCPSQPLHICQCTIL